MVTAAKKPRSSPAASAGAPTADGGAQQANKPIAYGIPAAAEASGLSRTTLYEEMDRGALAYVKVGCRRLILRDDLVAFLLKRRVVSA